MIPAIEKDCSKARDNQTPGKSLKNNPALCKHNEHDIKKWVRILF